MREVLLLLLLFVLFGNEIYAASRCGKTSFKVKYGQEKVFTSPGLSRGMCRYRIKVPPGLHVQLTLKEFDVKPCCLNISAYDAAVRPFKWRTAQKLSIPTGPQTSGTVVVFETYTIIFQLDLAAGNTPISFAYRPVIPTSGSFGYDVQAKKKKQSIRTPGFARNKLPSGVRSRWNIRSDSSQVISLVFRGFHTASDADYIEVYDGDRLLGRHTGKMNRKNPVKHNAISGTMGVYLHTETSKSRGFKATFQLITSVSSSVAPETGIRCYQGSRIKSQESTLSDDVSVAKCIGGQICARIIVEGQSRALGTDQTMTSESMSCMPRQMCESNLCETMTPGPDITVTSCQVACCTTDKCNDSPKAPGVTTGTRLRCHQSSEITPINGATLGSSQSTEPCPADHICALYVYAGESKSSLAAGNPGPVNGYTAKCAARSDCTAEACQSLRDSKYATITSCKITCCNSDMCNDPELRATPPPPPTPPPGPPLRCYELIQSRHRGSYLTNNKSVSTCDSPNSRCLRVDAVARTPLGTEVTTAYGRCVPATFCASTDCSFLKYQGNPGVKLTSCLTKCCDTDLCNDNPVTRPHTAGIQCHQKSEFVQESAIQLGIPPENNYCSEAEVCGLFVYHGTLRNEYNGMDEPMAGQFAGCTARSNCNRDGCSTLTNTRNGDISSCAVTCCGTDMCNTPGDTPMPSPMPGSTLRCYDIMSSRTGEIQVANRKAIATCDPGSRCLRMDATATDRRRIEIVTVFGRCVPAISCSAIDCGMLSSQMPGITLTSCKASCCDSDLCNENPSPSIPARPDVVLRCHSKSEYVRDGAVGVGSGEPTDTCSAGMICGRYVYHGTTTMYGEVQPVAGQTTMCTPASKCNSGGCADLPQVSGYMNVTRCKVSCCNSDLCNEPVDTPMPSAAPRPRPVNQCFHILSARSGRRELFNTKKVTECSDENARCVRVDALGRDSSGNEVVSSYGDCVPLDYCDSIDCTSVAPTVPGFEWESCRAGCCGRELCNENSLPVTEGRASTPPSTPTPSAPGIKCYQLLEMRALGTVLPGGQKSLRECDAGWHCLRVEATASQSSIEVHVVYGTCAPVCSEDGGCDAIPRTMAGVSIDSCSVKCCQSDFCNLVP